MRNVLRAILAMPGVLIRYVIDLVIWGTCVFGTMYVSAVGWLPKYLNLTHSEWLQCVIAASIVIAFLIARPRFKKDTALPERSEYSATKY